MADLAVIATREASHTMLEFMPLRDEELMLALPASHPVFLRQLIGPVGALYHQMSPLS